MNVFLLLILTSIGVALFDSLDIFTFLLLGYITKQEKASKSLLIFIISYFFSYWMLGVVLLFLGDKIFSYVDEENVVFQLIIFIIAISLIISGIVLFVKAYCRRKTFVLDTEGKEKEIIKKLKSNSPWRYMYIAVSWIVLYSPFAYPYFTVILTLQELGLVLYQEIVFLGIYSFLFIVPYLIFFGIYKYSNKNILEKLEKFLTIISNPMITSSVLLLLGILLLIW